MYARIGDTLVPDARIERIDVGELEARGTIVVVLDRGASSVSMTGAPAFDLLLRLAPHALEGPRLRFARRAWWVHNLVAHPLLQLCAWLGAVDLGLRVHDATIPAPVGTRPVRSPR